MAEGLLKAFRPQWEVFSAGVAPAGAVSRRTIRAMREIGIDISQNKPKHVDRFLSQSFDYVITVCDHAKESCPIFTGDVKNKVHIGFADPTKISGDPEEVFREFRRIRDDMKRELEKFAESITEEK
jgi:arsenate reductase